MAWLEDRCGGPLSDAELSQAVMDGLLGIHINERWLIRRHESQSVAGFGCPATVLTGVCRTVLQTQFSLRKLAGRKRL
jgi:hypothetical protein